MNILLKEAKKLGLVDSCIRDRVLSAILNGSKFVDVSPYEYQQAIFNIIGTKNRRKPLASALSAITEEFLLRKQEKSNLPLECTKKI